MELSPLSNSLHILTDRSVPEIQGEMAAFDSRLQGIWKAWRDFQLNPSNGKLARKISQDIEGLKTQTIAITATVKEVVKNKKAIPLEIPAGVENQVLNALRINEDFILATELQLKELQGYQKQKPQRNPFFAKPLTPQKFNKLSQPKAEASTEKERIQAFEYDMAFRQLLSQQGLEVRAIKGDGNCGLRAIARACYPTEEENQAQARLRQLMAEQMKDDFLTKIGEGVDYRDRMARDKAWIGEAEVAILADIVKRPIWIWDPASVDVRGGKLDPRQKYGQEKHGDKEPIHLYYLSYSKHFNLLEQRPLEK